MSVKRLTLRERALRQHDGVVAEVRLPLPSGGAFQSARFSNR